jgi:hypothetical protein
MPQTCRHVWLIYSATCIMMRAVYVTYAFDAVGNELNI